MIIRANAGKGARGAVEYNEQKVRYGEAKLLVIENYPVDDLAATTMYKAGILDRYASQNPRYNKPIIHLSLAFHPSETINDDTLKNIAAEYMEQMGYGEQPRLIYRHDDTKHPHIHIVSVKINDEGKTINQSNERYRSNAIRKELELTYNLVKAEEVRTSQFFTAALSPDAIHYGKQETKKAIGNILQTALNDYAFSSIDELSSFLASCHVQLNQQRGERVVAGETRQWAGVTFQLTNGTDPIGPAIKASTFSFAPTQDLLDKRFQSGARKNARNKSALLNRIDAERSHYATLTEDTYLNRLRQTDIRVIDTGEAYLYIDQKRRSVFSEQTLPEAYQRQFLQTQFGAQDQLSMEPMRRSTKKAVELTVAKPTPSDKLLRSVSLPEPVPIVLPRSKQLTKRLQSEPPGSTVPQPAPLTTTPSLSEQERITLGKQVSRHYQDYKKEQQITYESQLIRQFPFAALRQRMMASGQPADQTQIALREFERYKMGELPAIETREMDYFQQTSRALLVLSSSLPLTASSRLQFLSRLGLEFDTHASAGRVGIHTGPVLRSRENPAYQLTINLVEQRQLLQPSRPETPLRQLPFPLPFSRQQKQLYLALARQQPIPSDVSYTNVVYGLVRASLPAELADVVSSALNANALQETLKRFSNQTSDTLIATEIVTAFTESKLVIIGQAGRYKVGRADSSPGSYADLPVELSHVFALAQRQVNIGSHESHYTTTLPAQSAFCRAEQQEVDRLSYQLLSRDYRAYLTKTGVRYESGLLARPDGFPTSRLLSTLRHESATFPAGTLPEADVQRQVGQFLQNRMALLDSILTAEETQFRQRASHYLSLLSHESILATDRVKLLYSVGIGVVETTPGKLVLFDRQRPGVNLLLSQAEERLLRQVDSSPGSVVRPVVSLAEQACYEQGLKSVHSVLMVTPQNGLPAMNSSGLDSSGLDGSGLDGSGPDCPRYETLNVERLKSLLDAEQWQAVSQQLNRNSVEKLIAVLTAPDPAHTALHPKEMANGETLMNQLRQHGYLTALNKDGRTIRTGHYLSDPATWYSLPAAHRSVLQQDINGLKTKKELANAVAVLGSERGRATIRLANALRLGPPRQTTTIIQQITSLAHDMRPHADNPAELLKRLCQTTGPLFKENRPTSTEIVNAQQNLNGNISDDFGSLSQSDRQEKGIGDAIEVGMDTSMERRKKQRSEPIRPRRKA